MLNGLKMAICQMNVTPGRPDLNAAYIVGEIERAIERKVEVIFFSELCTTGYFIGDRSKTSPLSKTSLVIINDPRRDSRWHYSGLWDRNSRLAEGWKMSALGCIMRPFTRMVAMLDARSKP